MGVLNVTSYRYATVSYRAGGNSHKHYIQLEGSSDSGPAESAVIYFWPNKLPDTTGYWVNSLLVGLLEEDDFQYWLDTLRNEKPVKVTYGEDASDRQNKVRYISVGTTAEGVGEGPADPS